MTSIQVFQTSRYPHVWTSEREHLFELIYRQGLSEARVAEHYGISRERIRQVLTKLGLPYSKMHVTMLWMPWSPKLPFTCSACGAPGKNHGGGLCSKCYSKWKWANDPERRRKATAATMLWKAEHPEQARLLQNRATRAYRLRKNPNGRAAKRAALQVTLGVCVG